MDGFADKRVKGKGITVQSTSLIPELNKRVMHGFLLDR